MRYLKSFNELKHYNNELSLLKEELLILSENNINEGLFDKAKEFFKKTFQKGQYRYDAVNMLIKSIRKKLVETYTTTLI